MGTHWTSFGDLNAYIEYPKRKIAGSKSSCVASHSWYFATVKCLSSHLDKRAFVYTTTTKSWNWSQSSYKRRPNFSLSLLLSLVCVFISVIILEATGGAGKRLKTTREHEWNETFNYSCLRSFLRLTNAFRFSLSRFAITFFSSSTFTWNIVSSKNCARVCLDSFNLNLFSILSSLSLYNTFFLPILTIKHSPIGLERKYLLSISYNKRHLNSKSDSKPQFKQIFFSSSLTRLQ